MTPTMAPPSVARHGGVVFLPLLGKVLDECGTVSQVPFRSTNTMTKLIAYLLIALALGYALAVCLDPSFPDILEIIDNPKF